RLANSGVQLPGALKVTGELSAGRLSGVRFGSTGDPATDDAVDPALRKIAVAQLPAELSGRTIPLTLGPAPVAVAGARLRPARPHTYRPGTTKGRPPSEPRPPTHVRARNA